MSRNCERAVGASRNPTVTRGFGRNAASCLSEPRLTGGGMGLCGCLVGWVVAGLGGDDDGFGLGVAVGFPGKHGEVVAFEAEWWRRSRG